MVEVGDNVIVAPLDGQKDKMVVITGPAGGTGSAGTSGIIEGDYNTWTLKWSWSIPTGQYYGAMATYIDEASKVFYLWWKALDSPNKIRFASYNIADHSAIFESATDSDYINMKPAYDDIHDRGFRIGCWSPYYSILRSHETYLFLIRETDGEYKTIEVWKAGVLLWTRNVADDVEGIYASVGVTEISLTGKYIMFYESRTDKLLLYEGFDAGTSTAVTETVITDSSKVWAVNDLIGHIVYITSGGANEEQATITSNTGVTITCSAATFVTWGMSTGDTFKID